MYLDETIKIELAYFKRMNEHFTIKAGKSTVKVSEASDKILYIALSASLAMDISEDGFFEEFEITDKAISGKSEMLLDAYAFIEAENKNEKHLHLFQYKLYDSDSHSVSPVELMNFATHMNNNFVHPELNINYGDMMDPLLREITEKIEKFLSSRGRRVSVHCHFINNAGGITNKNEKQIQDVLGRFEYDKQHRNFKIQVYGLKEIKDLAIEGKIRVDSETIDFIVDGQDAYRLEDNSKREGIGLPKKVFVGICNVNEFIRLQNKYHHNQLYSENIRLYLGDRAAVNKDIIHTITNVESIWFPYMNNGISIICDKFSIGSTNQNRKAISLQIENMQIINGCQTVNALYSARYNEATKDDFRASNILVRIYEIDPNLRDFKLNVIKATNNQNAVKTYSLLANEPIQIAIQKTLAKFDYLYDRKGEAKTNNANKVISMPNGALAYRAVYKFEAQSLRSRIGQSRVFQKSEYEKIYTVEALEDTGKLYELSMKLLIATLILDEIRELINYNIERYLSRLPVFKKSAYYLAGYLYAYNKNNFDARKKEMVELLFEDNPLKIKGKNIPAGIIAAINGGFNDCVEKFIQFYDSLNLDKSDIDNLLKSNAFGKKYKEKIEEITGEAIFEDE